MVVTDGRTNRYRSALVVEKCSWKESHYRTRLGDGEPAFRQLVVIESSAKVLRLALILRIETLLHDFRRPKFVISLSPVPSRQYQCPTKFDTERERNVRETSYENKKIFKKCQTFSQKSPRPDMKTTRQCVRFFFEWYVQFQDREKDNFQTRSV